MQVSLIVIHANCNVVRRILSKFNLNFLHSECNDEQKRVKHEQNMQVQSDDASV